MQEHLNHLDSIIDQNIPKADILHNICQYLHDTFDHYNWVGFYFNNGDRQELKLGPYVGSSTDHVIIPFGRGICGQVAISNETFVVPDVTLQDNYLSCSLTTKSEIVVPIFKNGKNIGQIDIDSHTINPFTVEDQLLLESICSRLGAIL